MSINRDIPPWVWALLGLSGVGAVGYLLYLYFIKPGDIVLDQYKAILEDIYKETKDFLAANAQLDPPIYGLTTGQEAIIAAKNDVAESIRPEVEKIIQERGQQMWAWVETAVIGIIIAVAAPGVIKALSSMIKAWRSENPTASTNIASSRGHTHLLMELVVNEYALLGQTNIAGGFLTNIQAYYANYSQPSLQAGINYYTNLIPNLIPGSLAWTVATNMLTYMQFEISATTGLMATLWMWWLPLI